MDATRSYLHCWALTLLVDTNPKGLIVSVIDLGMRLLFPYMVCHIGYLGAVCYYCCCISTQKRHAETHSKSSGIACLGK